MPNIRRLDGRPRTSGLSRALGLLLGIMVLSVMAVTEASDSHAFPLPFSGTFQSLASEARELTSPNANSWVTIPQNVFLTLTKDNDIVELQLLIEVLDDIGRVRYPINNSMWLRRVADNEFEVYKRDKNEGRFEHVGDGSCTTASCAFQYVIQAQNNGNPYKQRYMSMITWAPDDIGRGFSQSGSLSAEVTDDASGEKSWTVFKTWANEFEPMPVR
jgi:hypothetical protein